MLCRLSQSGGTVTTLSDGMALPAASVVEKGTLNAASTDINGNFTLTVSRQSVSTCYLIHRYEDKRKYL